MGVRASKNGEGFFSWRTPFFITSFILLLTFISAVNVFDSDSSVASPSENKVNLDSDLKLPTENVAKEGSLNDAKNNFDSVEKLGIMKSIIPMKDISYQTITKEEYMRKNNLNYSSIGCWDCDDRNYETLDRQSLCECDEWEKCKDDARKSTAYNYDKSSVEYATDYCKDSSILREQYIDCYWTDEIFYTEKNCNDYDSYSGWNYYCTSTAVKRERYFYNYGCSDGACKKIETKTETEIVSDLGNSDYCSKRIQYGCSPCVKGDYDCDSDSECDSNLYCKGPTGDFTSDWYDGCCASNEEWDSTNHRCLAQCTDECSDKDTKCNGDSIQICGDFNHDGCTEWGNPINCGDDSCDNWVDYCKDNDVYQKRTCYDKGCSNNVCSTKSFVEEQLKLDCGDDSCDAWGANYCKNGNIYHSRICHDRGCSGMTCFDSTSSEEAKVSDCANGCSNGECVSIICSKNSDCGTNGWTGTAFCFNNDLYQSFRAYTCNNPGTAQSSCSNSDSNKLKQDCGNSGYTGSNYCYDDDVYRDYLNKGCSGTACFVNTEKKKQTECGTLGCDSSTNNCRTTCTPGQKRCNGNNIEQCNSDGLGWQTIQSCGTSSYCASTNPISCVSCESGKANCDQDISNTCEINLNTDNNNCGGCGIVCSSGTNCQSGTCQTTTTCTPGQKRCNGNNIEQCNSDGSGWTATTYCNYGCSNNQCIVGECSSTSNCLGNDFCKFNIGVCSYPGERQFGICTFKPSSCSILSDPVCGCDGETYVNECFADKSGMNIKSRGSCNSCTNECSSGQIRCSGSYKQTCGNYDADSCLEFGGDILCQYGCENGVCKSPNDFISNLNPLAYQLINLNIGSQYYIDRTYIIKSLPSYLQNVQAIKTKNDFLSQTTFSVNQNVRVYLAWDMREAIPSGWTKTIDKIYVSDSLVSNGGYLQLLYKDFNSGNVVIPKKNSKSNYIIFVVKSLNVLTISNLNPLSYQLTKLNLGAQYYTDRTFIIKSLPLYLQNVQAIKTKNDFLSQTTFNVNQNVRVYLAWDMREAIPSGWIKTSDKISVTDTGASNAGYLQVLYKDFNSGNVVIPKKNSKSNYIIFVVKR